MPDPIKISIPHDPIAEKSMALLIAINDLAKEGCAKALESGNLADWLRFRMFEDLGRRGVNSVKWIFDETDEYSAEAYISDFSSPELLAECEQNARVARSMWKELVKAQSSEDGEASPGTPSVICRVDAGHGDDDSWYRYRILAEFPPEYLQEIAKLRQFDSGNVVVFFEPVTACLNHASEVLYKDARDNGNKAEKGVIHRFILTPVEELRASVFEVVQDNFVSPETGKMQSANDMALKALTGMYSNEPSLYFVPKSLLSD